MSAPGGSAHAAHAVRRSGASAAVPTFKVLLIGDSAVGKSCIVGRAAGSDAARLADVGPTVGVDMRVVNVPLSPPVRLQVWDTAGQERYKSIAKQYYRGAQGVVVVYDVARRASFHAVRNWLANVLASSEPVTVALVGNKADLPPDERDVLLEEGEALAAELRVPFFETSALTGVGVDALFASVATRLREASGGSAAASSRRLPVGDGGGGDGAPGKAPGAAAGDDGAAALQRRVASVNMEDVEARGVKLHEQHEAAAARRRACGCG